MGWWEQSAEGESLFESGLPKEQRLLWGDGPADLIDDAITQIKVQFLRDVGRMPSKAEVIAGLKFSTNGLDDLAETPEHAPHTTKDQDTTIRQFAPWFLGQTQGLSAAELEEWRKAKHGVSTVLRELSTAADVTYVEVDLETGQQVVKDEPQPASTVPEGYSFHEDSTVIRGVDT